MLEISLIGLSSIAVFQGGTAGGDVLQMVLHAGPVVKLVLLILVGFSVISWAIIMTKALLFRQVRRQSQDFLDLFKEGLELKRIYAAAEGYGKSPIAHLFQAGYTEYNRLKKIELSSAGQDDNPSESTTSHMSARAMTASLQRALDKETLEQLNRLEQSMGFLATTGNTAPFVGLFGTVWGIMESFHSIGLKGAANLAVVAPGISEALVATAAGLAAAIPAVVAFNAFFRRTAAARAEMDMFAADFLGMVERQLFRRQAALGRTNR